MKKVVRNNLWMMIIAWCFFLNNNSALGMLSGGLASVYLFVNIRYKKYWRIIAVFLVCFSLSTLFGSLLYVSFFNYFTFFCGITSLNVALLNERLHKERLATLYPVFFVMFVCLIIFLLTALILPANNLLANAKANLYGLIVLIFIPYTSELLVSLIEKEYAMRRLLNKQKNRNTSKMYN